MAGLVPPGRDGALEEVVLAGADRRGADGLLELEDETGADRLDDGRGAALLAVGGVGEVGVVVGVDVGDGAAAGHVGHPVGHELAAHDEDAGRARAADELVRG